MVINIGINGFGRIGRIAFRASLQHEDLRVTAINDPAIDVEYFCYLLKYDSTHGKFKGELEIKEKIPFVDGSSINIYQHRNPSSIPWQNSGVQYIIESSGVFTTTEKASGHLQSDGVKRVIVTAPSVDVPMIILGVNDYTLTTDTKIISCASSTLYCLAPIMQVLEHNFGVEDGFVTSIHAMTPSLKPLDSVCVRGKHWRDHRSIHQNIIPATTGVCKALSRVMPQLRDKLGGIAFRVPVVDVSILDITIRLKTGTDLKEILKSIEYAKESYMKNIINIAKEEVVSSDFVEDSHSCTVDIGSSLQLKPNFYKIICWYENEYSYACRVLDTIRYCEQHLENNIYKNQANSIIRNSCESCPTDNNKYYPTEREVLKQNTKDTFTNYNSLTVIPIQIKNIVKDNISILFKSKPNKQACKTDEKVEKLKEEVTKYVNITEGLLKDSRRNRLSFKSTVCNLVNRDFTGRSRDRINNKSGLLNKFSNIEDKQAKLNAATDNNDHISSKSNQTSKNIECVNIPNKEVTKLSEKVLNEGNNTVIPVNLNKNNVNDNITKEIAQTSNHGAILKFKNKYFDTKYHADENEAFGQTKERDVNKIYLNKKSKSIILPERETENNITEHNNMIIIEIQAKSSNEEYKEPKLEAKVKEDIPKDIRNNKQDIILDKLGSVSGSNDSFEMNQRKSEIINLQDITQSLEDVSKLDQICKIIDISDDLSDRLFSPLNTPDNKISDRSSLKELCNKIHLDEFYENVFCSCDDEE